MIQANIIIDPKDLPKVVGRLTSDAWKYIAEPTTTSQDNAITLMWNSLRFLHYSNFCYLPEGVSKDIDALCTSYLVLGLVIGGDKDLLVKVLEESGARIKDIVDEGDDKE